ncbi:hypothetical protein HPB52_010400 [Rhipicephalus sanguineus]|uniref:Uncharacterized protein n=1 Tax=Rhipicephalus sanguineus TaxID=34632 RepID=A0A9D4PEN4_RHISA|nr:hypothetical protein HPB52_010400 [Rhipicephalus sanguineus]
MPFRRAASSHTASAATPTSTTSHSPFRRSPISSSPPLKSSAWFPEISTTAAVDCAAFNSFKQCSARSSDALYPAPAAFTDVLPEDRSPAVRGPRYPPSRGCVRTVATWTVLDSTDRPVAWTSRLPWEIQPCPSLGDPPIDAPETFRGLLFSDRHPIEPSEPYTAEETRILCPLCRVPETSRRAHQDGSLPCSRLLAARIRDTIPRPPQPPPAPTTVETAVALLRSARPDLLVQGALPAPTSMPPPTLTQQPTVDDLLDFDK